MGRTTESDYKRHQKVVAAVDLRDVPAGTPGRIMYVAGVTWIRYRVQFENGVELGSLDGAVLLPREEWEERQRQAARAARQAEQEALAAELRAKVASGQAPTAGGH